MLQIFMSRLPWIRKARTFEVCKRARIDALTQVVKDDKPTQQLSRLHSVESWPNGRHLVVIVEQLKQHELPIVRTWRVPSEGIDGIGFRCSLILNPLTARASTAQDRDFEMAISKDQDL
jgi:hypothetical protein